MSVIKVSIVSSNEEIFSPSLGTIVLNLYNQKDFKLYPYLSCLKIIGDPLKIKFKNAIIKIAGKSKINKIIANILEITSNV